MLADAGLLQQDAPSEPLIIPSPTRSKTETPPSPHCPGRRIKLEIVYEFEAPAPLGRQVFSFHLDDDDFRHTTRAGANLGLRARSPRAAGAAWARTSRPKICWSSPPTARSIMRSDLPNECARHKVLDLLGDLYLVGRPLRGRLIAHKSGHELNHHACPSTARAAGKRQP